jgi:hypothetical protein
MRKFILLILALFLVERFCRLQTEGFSVAKIMSGHPFDARWEAQESPLTKELLAQPFYFLGSGVQYYAFVSEDQKTVLKIVKPYHFCPNFILEKLPFPKARQERKKRLEAIFQSAKIAFEELKEETALLALHLNRTEGRYPKVKLYDKLNICHEVDLDQYAFALQKKAKPYASQTDLRQLAIQTIELIRRRCTKGIACSDPALHKNFGFADGHLIEIDIGSFTRNPDLVKPYAIRREILFETAPLKRQLKNDPELLHTYYETLFSS